MFWLNVDKFHYLHNEGILIYRCEDGHLMLKDTHEQQPILH